MDNREYLLYRLYRLRRNPANHVFIDLACEIDSDGMINFSKVRECSNEEDDYLIHLTRADGTMCIYSGGSKPMIIHFSENDLDAELEELPTRIIEAYRLWKQRTDVKEELKVSDQTCIKNYYICDTPYHLQ